MIFKIVMTPALRMITPALFSYAVAGPIKRLRCVDVVQDISGAAIQGDSMHGMQSETALVMQSGAALQSDSMHGMQSVGRQFKVILCMECNQRSPSV